MLTRQLAAHWNQRLRAVALEHSAYVYDAQLASENFDRMQSSVGDNVELLLSLKANPHPTLNRRILDVVAGGLDVSGLGELAVAAKLQTAARSVSLVGPGKTPELLAAAFSLPVSQIVFESEAELGRVAQQSPSADEVLRLLRINPKGTVVGANEVMAGGSSQFGVDEENAPALIKRMRRTGRLDGLHFFRGSQILDTRLVLDGIRYAVQTGLAIADQVHLPLAVLSVGGGLGVPHRESDQEVNLDWMRDELADIWRQLRSAHPGIQIQMEVGRFVYADAGVYLTRVIEVKRSRGMTFVIVESGVSGFSRPVVNWGEGHPVWKFGDPLLNAEDAATRCTIVGPTCLPGDRISTDAFIRKPREDDIIVVGNAGAYGRSMSLTSWGSLPQPREFVV